MDEISRDQQNLKPHRFGLFGHLSRDATATSERRHNGIRAN